MVKIETNMADANSMACHPRATCHIAGCCHLANSIVMIPELCVTLQGAGTGRIQRHVIPEPVSHCRVLPLCEFTVMIPEPHATSQGTVTWRNQCHDRATLQGVIIPSTILKIVYRHILFIYWFLMQFGL